LFKVAAMLGRNRAMEREPWPEDAPSIWTVRTSQAMAAGRPKPSRDEPISDDEYRALLALVKGGRRG